MPRLVPGGEVHVLPVRVPAGEQDQHVDHLQEVRAERAALRKALILPGKSEQPFCNMLYEQS